MTTNGDIRATKVPIIGISRHRISTDGDGVTTLVAFHGCPLRCRYCLNPQSLGNADAYSSYSPEDIYSIVRVDELYFLASGGGVTFGGGEPALNPRFISEFRRLCGNDWKINVETSLNVPSENIVALLGSVNTFIIDIKDLNGEIYKRYTGRNNELVISNLHLIADAGRQNDCLIRLPLIPVFNTDTDRDNSRKYLEALGFTRFNPFTYKTKATLL